MKTAEVLGTEEILRMLPHRHPFVLLDRVVDLDPGRQGMALKNISISDPCFEGHFPGRPIYPGVLLMECLAQLSAIVYGSGALKHETGWEPGQPIEENVAGRIGYLVAIRNAKFTRVVRPGDQVILTVHVGPRLGELMDVQIGAAVGSEQALTGKLTVSEVPGDNGSVRHGGL